MDKIICPQLNIQYQELKTLQTQYDSMCDNFDEKKNYEEIKISQDKINDKIRDISANLSKIQTAYGIDEIKEYTKTYIGEWNIDVFNKLKNHRHIKDIYESYPDKKIFMQTIETNPEEKRVFPE